MLFPKHLQTVLDAALIEVQNDTEHQLSAATRIKIYTMFDEYYKDDYSDDIFPIRGYLALITAKRVIHNWDVLGHKTYEHYGIDGTNRLTGEYYPLADSQKVHYLTLMICEDVLFHKKHTEQTKQAWHDLYNLSDGMSYYNERIVQDNIMEIEAMRKASQSYHACYLVMRDINGINHPKFWFPILNKEEIDDTAILAMLSECGKDKAKALKFWIWWLSEAIPRAWEKVYGIVKL